MKPLLDLLSDKLLTIFDANGLDTSFARVRVSDRPDLAPFQCNGAMGAAKKIGKNPRDVAAIILDAIKKDPDFIGDKCEIAGPGFINLHVTDAVIDRALSAQIVDQHHGIPQIGAGKNVMLDYGGPQIAKHMHVGHLRTAIVGDTLRRILKSAGYHAVGDIHMGDWGLQMGMVISELEHRFPSLSYFDPNFKGTYPSDPPVPFDDMGELYPTAAQACKSDSVRMDQARKATLDLQQKRPGYMALWENVMRVSVDAMHKNYASLNVHFDVWKGEKDADFLIPDMIENYKLTSHAILSDGAWIIPVAKNEDKKEMPPLILVKRDGAYLYSTTDLATIIDRINTENPSWLIYIVDQRQGLHFDQVFRAARLGRLISDDTRLDFAGVGTMNGPDGTPFKTRAGGVLRLQDLIQMGVDKARDRMDASHMAGDVTDTERDTIARTVAVAAIKFADLKNPRHVDYVFDLDAMTSFEGKTGPYILYQAVRIQSILLKCAEKNIIESGAILIDDDIRTLALLIIDFPNAVTMSIENLSAHILADYLYRLAQEFSAFYNTHHILSEPDQVKVRTWLYMCRATHDTLTYGLSLMGIDVPERM